ncbi:MAG: cytochrome c [Paracoccus sp. (in: a-proteobacteria)]|nr:cytochrome c [Paracoccus sp. (in: a-proteobacteria)]
MPCRNLVIACVFLALPASAQQFGRAATADEIALWDIDVRADGAGLPDGHGTAAQGAALYEMHCAACHGETGEGGPNDRLVGGHGSLATDAPVKTVGSYWPYATTLYDYIGRAMPYYDPGSLTADETYAVAAYILAMNDILPGDGSLDRNALPLIEMPNRHGFIPEPEFAPLLPGGGRTDDNAHAAPTP